MDIIPQPIQNYCNTHTSPESDLLQTINKDTHREVLMPRMLSGHFQGRLLAMMSAMIKPKYVLEIGTYTGYSALCIAEHVQEGGKLYTLDINDELQPRVQSYFNKSPYKDKLEFIVGPAKDSIPTLSHIAFDLVFIDADKKNYSIYYDLTFPLVKKGGFILADNVLWSGKVTQPEYHLKDKDLPHILSFNEHVHQDIRVENILLPIRDGLMLVRKKD